MSLVVCRIRPSIHAAYQAHAETVGATLKAVYDKLDRTETADRRPPWSTRRPRGWPRSSTRWAAPGPAWLPGYRVRILDGNHLAGTEHRIKELRTIGAGALPGHALVVLDPRLMLATDVVLCEDGHAQERSLLDQVLELVAAQDLWIADRNFCTTELPLRDRRSRRLLRRSASTPRRCTGSSSGSGGRAAGSRPARSSSRRSGPPTTRARS